MSSPSAKLYDIKTAITAADLVNNRVLPFYDEPGISAVGAHNRGQLPQSQQKRTSDVLQTRISSYSLTRAEITSVRLKCAFDLFAATVGVMALTPVFLCIAVAIKIDSPGPVFFRQERVGRQGRPFRIHKFRTMRAGAEQDGKLTVASDPRVTRVGRYLRKMKLDELPQLFDILSGSMSFVGPRPEVPGYVVLYPPEVRQIVLSVKPGVTDPASIAFRNESEMLDCDDPERLYIDRIMPAKLAHYVDYIRTRSFVGDLRIIVRTIRVICTKGRASA